MVDRYIQAFERYGWPLAVVQAIHNGATLREALEAWHRNGR